MPTQPRSKLKMPPGLPGAFGRGLCRLWTLAAAGLALSTTPSDARGGGGHAFSGGHSFGGGGGVHFGSGGGHYGGYYGGYSPGGDSGVLVLIILVIIVYVAIKIYSANQKGQTQPFRLVPLDGDDLDYTSTLAGEPHPANLQETFARLRRYDPNFSEIAFNDFVYTLYGRAHESRGQGDLESLSPYLSPAAIASLAPTRPAIRDVTGVIVGGATIVSVTDPDAAPEVAITVRYEANYTEVDAAGQANSFYAVESWVFTRNRDVTSPAPEQIAALHCPKCGGALDKNADGSCAYCGVKITGGDFHWYVQTISVVEREPRGPLLTSDVPEEGTDLATIYQPDLLAARDQFLQANPAFNWERTEERFRHIFQAVQDGWSSLHWEKVRPFETDNIFQMHRYWIEAYQKQHLRNVLEDVQIQQLNLVKLETDAFYDAITVRIFAAMKDYTVDAAGKVVCGSHSRPRPFSEYWTFIRRKGAGENQKENTACPNCGAPLKVNMAGDCEYCGGKIVNGSFDWVLSRIEQDEAYVG